MPYQCSASHLFQIQALPFSSNELVGSDYYLWDDKTSLTTGFSSKFYKNIDKMLIQKAFWKKHDPREILVKAFLKDRKVWSVDFFFENDFPVLASITQLFSQTVLLHTLCNSFESFLTINKLFNSWSHKTSQFRTDKFLQL